MTSIKWNGQEVKGPFYRILAAFFVVVGVAVMVPVGMVIMVFGLLISAPFHPVFRVFGRKGIFRGNGEVIFDKTSFERR